MLLSFRPNTAVGDMQCVNYTILDDSIVEPVEFFTVKLSTAQLDQVAVDADAAIAVVSIVDNDIGKYMHTIVSLPKYLHTFYFNKPLQNRKVYAPTTRS